MSPTIDGLRNRSVSASHLADEASSETAKPESSAIGSSASPRSHPALNGLSPRPKKLLTSAEAPLAAYAAARTLVGEALDPESTTQLRKANDAMDKARRALSAGAGNIARTGSPGNMDALRRTNATRALAKALSHSLCNPGEETAALVRCWPRQMLSEVLRDMSAEERSDLLNHVVAAATALSLSAPTETAARDASNI